MPLYTILHCRMSNNKYRKPEVSMRLRSCRVADNEVHEQAVSKVKNLYQGRQWYGKRLEEKQVDKSYFR
jgi:hypothetical protein